MNLLLDGVMTAYSMEPDLGDGNLLFLFKFDDNITIKMGAISTILCIDSL